MPIQPENRARYPAEWPLISLWVRVCAAWRCEWCDAQQVQPHPVTGSRVVLTVAHVLNPAPEDVRPANLAALCQRCHLNHDRAHHLAVQAVNRQRRRERLSNAVKNPESDTVGQFPSRSAPAPGKSLAGIGGRSRTRTYGPLIKSDPETAAPPAPRPTRRRAART